MNHILELSPAVAVSAAVGPAAPVPVYVLGSAEVVSTVMLPIVLLLIQSLPEGSVAPTGLYQSQVLTG